MTASSLNILFDGQIFVEQAAGGISRYYTALAADLNAEPETRARIVAPLHRNEILAASEDAPVLGISLPNNWYAAALCRRALRASSPLLSRFMPADIVHETYFSDQPYLTSAKRRVTTVYDMIHERYYPDEGTAERKKASLARCDHAICISHSTKNDLCEMLDFPAEKASVTHLPYEDFSVAAGSPAPAALGGAPYFLFVGNRGGHKNFDTMLRAFAASSRLRKDYRIACFGGGKFTPAELSLASSLGIPESTLLHLPGGDAMLGSAYANATAFVYPSLYEGFGIPPLEAMSAGCPVICSNTSSLPEVVGDAALSIDPADADALKDALERVAGSEKLWSELVRRGHVQRQNFTRARTAQQTLAIYRSLM